MVHIPINHRTLPYVLLSLFVIVGGCMYAQSRDVALSKAREFAANAPQVLTALGPGASTTLLKSVYYEGIPGKEVAYRQYTILVTGKSGSSITVQIRAYPTEAEGNWNVQLLAAN